MARFNRSKEDWSQSSLEIYLREINKTPLLTAEQEKQDDYPHSGQEPRASRVRSHDCDNARKRDEHV